MRGRNQGEEQGARPARISESFKLHVLHIFYGVQNGLATLQKGTGCEKIFFFLNKKALCDTNSHNKGNIVLRMLGLHSEMTRTPRVKGLDSRDVQNMQLLAHRGSKNHFPHSHLHYRLGHAHFSQKKQKHV